MGTLVRSAYPEVHKALEKFEAYVRQLSEVTSLPQSPNACAPIDASQFAAVASAMRQLPVCTVPQLVNAALRSQIENLQERYRQCLLSCEKKGVMSSASREALLRNVAGQPADNQRSASAQSVRTSSSANTGFFAFNNNEKKVAQSQQPSAGLFSAFRKMMTA